MKIDMNFQNSTVGDFKPGEIGLINETLWLAINRCNDYDSMLFMRVGSDESGVSMLFSENTQCKKLLGYSIDNE